MILQFKPRIFLPIFFEMICAYERINQPDCLLLVRRAVSSQSSGAPAIIHVLVRIKETVFEIFFLVRALYPVVAELRHARNDDDVGVAVYPVGQSLRAENDFKPPVLREKIFFDERAQRREHVCVVITHSAGERKKIRVVHYAAENFGRVRLNFFLNVIAAIAPGHGRRKNFFRRQLLAQRPRKIPNVLAVIYKN